MLPPDDFDPAIGVAEELEPGLRRLVAPNPSPMTYRGTNTYLLGTGGLAVIDPGPADDSHLAAILASVGPDQKITHIIVTHTHLDHSPLARPLADACGAPIHAFGGATAGRSEVMQELAQSGLIGGGEGIDSNFAPDILLKDGEVLHGDGWQLEALHTPGHIGNHLSLGWGDACFTADHVMGWASSLVSPPDGDLTDFMASCAKLAQGDWRIFYPGHGAAVTDTAGRLAWLVAHRNSRETAILQALDAGPATARSIAEHVYAETPAALLGAATRNVLAHLVDLTGKTTVEPRGPLHAEAEFQRVVR
ncbi:MBL fold metallo-hydrolase [Sulfitobacter sp. M57]|uniref:MBL fold metallo-hydrolase n=1 Tax=unclassified Sulfitobacter TaxID=196795 RepID=UPI0023E17F83|nr:MULTISPECIES: MBL fold metallo-hydrolase [unclassified Sulfitobacter]MDF3413563.1 MBL fold metallo-hydrolase [Sulfitobacter sp. KE5]MDF3421155.1 MBL fold metallo-hydrolase [Sulfitobacter sp. KE43]MDF3432110.1 MBL fold metallo-hydrolase [Sulfitobacter sp. KE42]MDF3457750.1 MBL fold metallo-hydrolase [Sulfitobacter sp. S74]MDF3461651.1 MBL fold metallo-hydrolase [Sulfitobacter sp. Ks18]